MELDSMVGTGETILWKGKPNRKCFAFEAIFNPMLPFAIVWAIIDMSALIMSKDSDSVSGLILIPFILLHMMPVWIYLAGVFTISLKYKHERYIITDHSIYASHGMFSVRYDTKLFADMSRVDVHRGIFDQFLNVGDVVVSTTTGKLSLIDLPDYEDVFKMVKKLQEDVYTDVQYPNALRPQSNSGYHVEYDFRGPGRR